MQQKLFAAACRACTPLSWRAAADMLEEDGQTTEADEWRRRARLAEQLAVIVRSTTKRNHLSKMYDGLGISHYLAPKNAYCHLHGMQGWLGPSLVVPVARMGDDDYLLPRVCRFTLKHVLPNERYADEVHESLRQEFPDAEWGGVTVY